MHVYRYSRWDGTQEVFPIHQDDLMEELSEQLMAQGDLSSALRAMAQRGVRGRFGERIKGLQDLLQQLRSTRQHTLDRYNLDSVLQDIQDKLDKIVQAEAEGIHKRVEDARRRSQESQANPNTVGRGLSPELQQQLLQRLEKQAAQNLETLDKLPKTPAEAINELRKYEFMDPRAKQMFDELLKELQRQVANSYFKDISQRLQSMTPEQLSALKQMMRDLNRMLRDKRRGEEDPGDFQEFMRKYGQMFGPQEPQSLDELLESIHRQISQMQSLLDSLSQEQRDSLQELLQSIFNDLELQSEMSELADHLEDLHPLGMLRREYPFHGDEPMTLEEAMKAMEKLQKIDELEKQLRRSQQGADLRNVDNGLMEEVLGKDALQAMDQLKNITEMLEQAGYIRKLGNRYELTPKGMRKIGQKALEEIFSYLKKDRLGKHRLNQSGRGGDRVDETKAYEFGDPFHLDLNKTLVNALERQGPGVPIRLAPEDFEVNRTELLTQSSTVLLVDLSLSMAMRGNFLAAKKVALALDSLIRTQFPRDNLFIVGFSTYAREVKSEKLPYLSWDEFDPYTNIQHGLILAQKLLSRVKMGTKQIVLISDGEPTAHLEGGQLFLQYPPSPRTIRETLKEVKRCTQQSIIINTFMLDRNTYLIEFVEQLAKLNRGRVFYTTPDRLGQYILIDYLSNRRRKLLL